MDNKTEYFTLKEDGVIGWIENMPKHEWIYYCRSDFACDSDFEEHQHHEVEYTRRHQQALQSAISNAIEVSNPEEVKVHIFRTNPGLQYILENTPYPLQCHVEKKEERRFKTGPNWSNWYPVEPLWATDLAFQSRTLALVTFSESSAGVEETQEELGDAESFFDATQIINFATWYSGMDREKVKSAYKRYINEKLAKKTNRKNK